MYHIGIHAASDFFADSQACTMQTDADSSRLKIKNLRHLFSGEFFHVVENEDDAQLGGNSQQGLVELIVLLSQKDFPLGIFSSILKKAAQAPRRQASVHRARAYAREHWQACAACANSDCGLPCRARLRAPEGR